MKKKLIVIGCMSLLLCGCGKIPKLSNGDEAIVKMKDGKMISANDFYNEIKDTYGLATLVHMIDKYIYETEVSDKKTEAKEYSELVIKQMRASQESEEALLQYIQTYYSYQTVEGYQDAIYLNYLQKEAFTNYVKDNLTEKELKDYYDKNIFPDMTISHILITPKVTSTTSEADKKTEEEKAKKEIESIISELDKAKKNGENIAEKFASLAKEKSEDSSSKDKGGSLGKINIGSLSASYDELVKAADELKDGEYSTKVITTELGYHVILKTETGEKKSYDDSLNDMKDKIAENKISTDQKTVVDAMKFYRDKYDIDIIDSEISSQYGKYMNNLINSANSSSN